MRIVIQVANCKPVQLSLCLYNASAYPFFKSPFEVRHRLRAVRQVRGIALMFSPCGEGYQRAHKKGTHGLRSFPFAPFTCLSIVKEYRCTKYSDAPCGVRRLVGRSAPQLFVLLLSPSLCRDVSTYIRCTSLSSVRRSGAVVLARCVLTAVDVSDFPF